MYNIKRVSENKQTLTIGNALWGYTEYTPDVKVCIEYDDEGFIVKFTICEKNPLREKTENFNFVHEDSCVEFFVNFMPEASDYYINFETNANGVMNVGYRTDRYNTKPLLEEEVKSFNITPYIFDNYWTVEYKIGFDFIKKYYPGFDIEKCEYVKANLYKCGEKTEYMHFMSYFDVKCEKPDFHRPEYFGKIYIEK